MKTRNRGRTNKKNNKDDDNVEGLGIELDNAYLNETSVPKPMKTKPTDLTFSQPAVGTGSKTKKVKKFFLKL
jgi:hypothetical protein